MTPKKNPGGAFGSPTKKRRDSPPSASGTRNAMGSTSAGGPPGGRRRKAGQRVSAPLRPPAPKAPENFDPLVISDENFAYYNRWRMHQGLKPVAREAYERAVWNQIQVHKQQIDSQDPEVLTIDKILAVKKQLLAGKAISERLDRERHGQVD